MPERFWAFAPSAGDLYRVASLQQFLRNIQLAYPRNVTYVNYCILHVLHELRRADWDSELYRAHRRTRPLRLGFLTVLTQERRDPNTALQEGLRLFGAAEHLGYHLGLVRVRHFQPYLSGPISFLSAASQRTSTMRLGTGVIPMHAEDPIRLAEELQTLDVTSKADSWDKFDGFLDRISGVPLKTDPDTFIWGLPEGSSAVTTPSTPTLRDRIWYGAGSMNSVALTAKRGLKLQLSSVTDEVDIRLEPRQYQQIASYREQMTQLHPARTPRSCGESKYPSHYRGSIGRGSRMASPVLHR